MPEKANDERSGAGDSGKEPTAEERRFTVDELKERARSTLGVSPHAVAGALSGEKPDKRYSVEQAEKKLKSFLGNQVEDDVYEPDEAAA